MANIPVYIKESIDLYVSEGIEPGKGIRSILENNLFKTFSYADDELRPALHDVIKYIYCQLPGNCWGDVQTVKEWLNKKVKH